MLVIANTLCQNHFSSPAAYFTIICALYFVVTVKQKYSKILDFERKSKTFKYFQSIFRISKYFYNFKVFLEFQSICRISKHF